MSYKSSNRRLSRVLVRKLRRVAPLGLLFSAIVAPLCVMWTWDWYKRPSLRVQYAVTVSITQSARFDHDIHVQQFVTDFKTRRMAARSLLIGADTSLVLSSPRFSLVLKLELRNVGHSPFTELLIPIYARYAGTPSIESSPGLNATLSSSDGSPLEHVDMIKIAELPARATGVVTYRLEIDSSPAREPTQKFAVPLIQHWSSHELGQEPFEAHLESIFRLLEIENRVGPGPGTILTIEANKTGKRGPLSSVVQILDPERVDSVAADAAWKKLQ